MYTIIDDRRITSYVLDQAYIWLYDQIRANKYTADDIESSNILLKIKSEQKITKTSYELFLNHFINDPHLYVLMNHKNNKVKGIVTTEIRNYFVKYNDAVLPVGFIQEFFEDDYDTKKEINAFFEEYLVKAEESFEISVQKTTNEKTMWLDKTIENNPGLFKTKFKFHFTNVFKFILVVLGFILSATYFTNSKENGFISFVTKLKQGEEFANANPYLLAVANVIFLIFMISNLAKVIKTVLFYIDFFRIRGYIRKIQKALDTFNIQDFKEFFLEINEAIKDADYSITDDVLSVKIPGRDGIVAVMELNEEEILGKIRAFDSAKYRWLHFFYRDEKELHTYSRRWGNGIPFTIILLVVFTFANITCMNAGIQVFWEVLVEDGPAEAIKAGIETVRSFL